MGFVEHGQNDAGEYVQGTNVLGNYTEKLEYLTALGLIPAHGPGELEFIHSSTCLAETEAVCTCNPTIIVKGRIIEEPRA